ncbi:hypothetical protein BH10CYA1_BH10CYA1_02870 [soil metagenome]
MIRRVCLIVAVAAQFQLAADAVETKSTSAAHAAIQSKDFVKAEKLCKQALLDTRRMKENDPRLSQSLDDLAQVYIHERKFDDARPLFMRVLKIKESKYGKDSPELIKPLNDVVRVTCAGGACYDTIPHLKRLLSIRRKAEPNSRDIPVTLLLIGEAYEKREKYPEALDYFQQCVVAEKLRAGHSPMVATYFRNVERVKHELAICKK